jgi:hypothetical protein
MDLDTLIPIIFVLLFVVAQIFKSMASQKKDTSTQKKGGKPGIKDLLTDIASQIKKEIEAANAPPQPQPQPSSGWEKVMPPKPEKASEHKQAPTPEQAKVSHKKRAVKAPPILHKKGAADRKLPEKKVPVKPTAPEKRSFPETLDYTTQGLRRAVVWSEILAPPLALRDSTENDRF